MKNTTLILKTAVTLLFLGAFLTRCANIMSPNGGPKDTLPPVITAITPGNFATNFTEKKIYIEFNEYVQIKDQNKELFTSPAMKKMPLISTRGKGIVITIRDTLKENTTYAIDLGSAIRDNNEGNPLNAMRYVFSTGSTIDSLLCSGYTADSYKADSVSRTFLWFYIADSLPVTPDYDSTIFNRKPDVIARAQNNGIFIAQNLKPVKYRIYAIGDKNDNQMYEPGTDLVGILDSTYNPAELPPFAIWFDSLRHYPSADPQLYFRMFTDKTFKAQRLVEAVRGDRKKITLYFNTALPTIDSLVLDSIPSEKIIFDPRTKGKDTLNLWLNMPDEKLPDTIKGSITYYRHDSIRQLVKTTESIKVAWKYTETKEEQKEREKEERERKKAEEEGREYTPPKKANPFKYKSTASGEINPEKGFEINLDFPLVEFDSTSVKLYKLEGDDKNPTETEVERHFERDTLNIGRYFVRAKWESKSKYRFYIPQGSMTDVMGYQNDSISSSFSTFDPEKFSKIVLTVKGEEGKKYIIQQTDASSKTQQQIEGVTSGQYTINFVSPGEIRIRIIEDTNGNGRWDAGDVVNRLQPERSEMFINDKGEDLFATKANWDIEIDIDMSNVFKPLTMENLIKILDEKEAARIKKLSEEWEKKRIERLQQENQNNSGMGNSGGMMGGFGGMMGGLGGMTGSSNSTGRLF